MKERGVLFGDEAVRRILDGTKTQTRRPIVRVRGLGRACGPGKVLKVRESDTPGYDVRVLSSRRGTWWEYSMAEFVTRNPLGQVGDRIWIKESACYKFNCDGDIERVCAYRADIKLSDPMEHKYVFYPGTDPAHWNGHTGWESPSRLLKWASRLTLEITAVRAQQVQDISYDDIIAEGWDARLSQPFPDGTAGFDALEWFRTLWDSRYATRGYGFDVNPWVWAYTFRKVEGEK